ncbi:F0F1 ATP synthase subunit B/delta [Tsukamurella paurometabola]|uniref:Multifunctional fusion protein n=1 Tax=Tsukamurella paurometabola TaxID=2061 RepID=A0ABS5NHK9_TSUPA|nr:F0F1 ATP synthase subunit B/delta [Tsukamurella paurometabola]MBS4103413.1 F0F1 ATP synthase subunit B/delta [Tsukamurella paurometabola]
MGVFIGNLIAFAVILFVLWKFVVPPVKRLMKERQDTVRAQLEESRIAQEKLAQAGQAGERARSDAAREGSQIRDEARGDADAIREELRAQTEREVARIGEHGQGQIALNRSNLVRGLRAGLGAEAVDVAGRLVRDHLSDPANQVTSVDRALDELESMTEGADDVRVSEADRIGTRSLRAASRDAVRSLAAGFDQRTAGLDQAALARVADDLADVVNVLGEQPVLRKHLAESAEAPEAKRTLVENLFGGKISAEANAFVQDAAAAKWSAPADFVTAVERQARVAVLLGAERAGSLDETEDELFRAGRILEGEPELTAALSDTRVPAATRIALLDKVFGGKVNEFTVALLRQTVRLVRVGRVDAAVASIADLAAARRGESVAVVESAVALTDAQRTRTADLLARIYQRKIAVQTEVVAELLGGLRITVGNEVIEADIASRLDKAADQLPR